MINIKNAFRSNKSDSRASTFTKHHEALHHQESSDGLGVETKDLSDKELEAYRSWWKDLNPFGLDSLNSGKALEFISSSGLSDEILTKIISLCQHEKVGLNQKEFFSILRLISHAQKGYGIAPSLVHEKVSSLPRFRTEAIEISLKPISSCDTSLSNSLGSEQSNSPFSNCQSKHGVPTQATRFNKLHPGYHHSRSRSLPFNPFTAPQSNSPFGTLETPPVNSGHSRHGKHKSVDAQQLSHMVDKGQSLLLTQGFIPKFINESEESMNPFDSGGSSPQISTPPTPTYPNMSLLINDYSNKYKESPPSVPPQSTKPEFPKYAHNKR